MSILSERNDRRSYKTWQVETWNDEFDAFCEKCNSEKIEIKTRDEFKNPKADFEQSILSQLIFGKLINIFKKSSSKILVGSYYSLYCDNDEQFCIYYDVMNTKGKTIDIESIYHSIGNYSCYPQMEGISLQFIHKYFNEKWDEFLVWLRENWNKCDVMYTTRGGEEIHYKQHEAFIKKWGVSFDQYMIMTCQQMYYKKIFNDISEKDFDSFSNEKLLEIVTTWNKEIITNKLEIISIEERDIPRLIHIREKVIFATIAN